MKNKENYYAQSQIQIFKQITKKKDTYYVGEIHPYIFDNDDFDIIEKSKKLDVAIIYMGSFELNNSIFPKIKCPTCNKEETLIPYFCGASLLSGCHIIKFYCPNCGDLIVTNNNSDYYHMIRDYIIKNKNNLNKSSKIKSCTVFNDDNFV